MVFFFISDFTFVFFATAARDRIEYTLVMFSFLLGLTQQKCLHMIELLLNIVLMIYELQMFLILSDMSLTSETDCGIQSSPLPYCLCLQKLILDGHPLGSTSPSEEGRRHYLVHEVSQDCFNNCWMAIQNRTLTPGFVSQSVMTWVCRLIPTCWVVSTLKGIFYGNHMLLVWQIIWNYNHVWQLWGWILYQNGKQNSQIKFEEFQLRLFIFTQH